MSSSMATDHRLRNAALLLATASFATLASCAGLSDQVQPSSPTAAAEPVASTCSFGAFVAETDPAGLNVRAAPNATAKVIGKLPPTFVEPSMNDGVRVEVEVLGARNGWFLIRNATDNEVLTDRPARPMYAGEGWVSGNKLTVKSQADVGRAQPNLKAKAVLRVGDNETFDSDVLIEAGRLADCTGKWAQVEFVDQRVPSKHRSSLKVDAGARAGLPAGRFRAWVNRICAIQETSCDGLASDSDVDTQP
ncbi:SH3 domain-containing protein [Roseateles amylovorans]|uniref:SH3 domain-containing protein n=1 Tax=Roseateles amylovorans TaxID=2978473 RepID=A0ABY6AZN9_9BURK|nr:SH3 domain-containing protein [Roseateles amylovorans]UXH78383.1 SH3 domain-containing protein [Roseateles amylovorans]